MSSENSPKSLPLVCPTETDDIVKVKEAADKALKNIQSLYNEIMTPKSYSDLDEEFDVRSLHLSSPSLSVQNESQTHIRNSKPKRRSDLCRSCQTYISYCSSCHKDKGSNRKGPIIQNNLLNPTKNINETSPKFNITIPQPFSITAENVKRQEAKAIKIAKLKEELEKEREKELNVRIRSHPAPMHIHQPLYEEMTKKNEKRKQERKEKCLAILEKETKPFNLSTSKKFIQSKSTNDLTKDCVPFKARPAPKNILSENVSKRIRDKEELRKILITHRAEEMLKQSSLPFSPKTIPRSYSMSSLISDKNQNKFPKPNIDAITKRLYTIKCKETMDNWNNKVLEQDTCHNRCCNAKKNDRNINNYKSKLLPDFVFPFYNFPVRMSTAAMLREKQIRTELSLRKQKEEQGEITKEEIAKKKKEFLKNIWSKLKSLDPTIDPKKEIEEKVKDFKESQRTRQHEYEKELEEMMKRVSKQYLLIERQSKEIKHKQENVGRIEDYSEKQSSNEEEDTDKQMSNEDEASDILSNEKEDSEILCNENEASEKQSSSESEASKKQSSNENEASEKQSSNEEEYSEEAEPPSETSDK